VELRRQTMSDFQAQSASAKNTAMTKLGQELILINKEYQDFTNRGGQTKLRRPFQASNRMLRYRNGLVVIDAVAQDDPKQLRNELVAMGLQHPAIFGRYVSGLMPISQIMQIGSLNSLRLARLSYARTSTGTVTSQGDTALNADTARTNFSVDGTGITVGSLSDSYNCLGAAAANVATDDLPSGVIVLADETGCSSGTDEGRAMMQIIHDIAPGADQAFHTAFDGIADFALGIIELQTVAGADIITDDVFYFAEPFFQDGPIAQAVDSVKDSGVAYFSAAGNRARQAYTSSFVNSGQSGFRTGSVAHDFDPGSGVDTRQQLTIPAHGEVIFVLQWDQPFFSVSGAPGSASDIDIVLYPNGGDHALAASIDNNTGGDAWEAFIYTNNSGSPKTVQLGIDLVSGPAPGLMTYIYFGTMTVNQYATDSPTIVGHANAAGAQAVGAVRYHDTPAFGVTPPIREYFSSVGGNPILFDTAGIPTFQLRQKPEIMAPDGGDNTFFGSDYESNGFPNFFGTSAAAPHAAGIAALMKAFDPTALPDKIYNTLQATALDMDAAGVDFDSGFGLIDANQAVAALTPLEIEISYQPEVGVKNQFYWWGGLTASGGLPPYTYTLVGGWLLWPLTLKSETGVIMGEAFNTGSSYFTVQVMDANSNTATIQSQITINKSDYVCGLCHRAEHF
ncbi:MAG: S8 family serine peptidase, partial [Gammaproteobacteria bacterium]|nr:S8 family serine peptidase [Gammaproteobacteria bacterium]